MQHPFSWLPELSRFLAAVSAHKGLISLQEKEENTCFVPSSLGCPFPRPGPCLGGLGGCRVFSVCGSGGWRSSGNLQSLSCCLERLLGPCPLRSPAQSGSWSAGLVNTCVCSAWDQPLVPRVSERQTSCSAQSRQWSPGLFFFLGGPPA